ncbi:unnamed protein product [Musa banksii]
MSEEWLVKAGLSPATREMVNLQCVKGSSHDGAATPSSRGGDVSRTESAPQKGTLKRTGSPEVSRPRKKTKTTVRKKPAGSVARESTILGSPEAAPQVGGVGSAKVVAGSSGSDPLKRAPPRPTSTRHLCRARPRADGEEFESLAMVDLSTREPGTPYTPRWTSLQAYSRIWGDGSTTREFLRGALHPAMAKELYCSPSEALADRAAKLFVWGQHYAMALIDRVLDVGRVIEC